MDALYLFIFHEIAMTLEIGTPTAFGIEDRTSKPSTADHGTPLGSDFTLDLSDRDLLPHVKDQIRSVVDLPIFAGRLTAEQLRYDEMPKATPPIELFYDSIADRFDTIMNMYDMRRRVETIFDVFLRDYDLSGRKVLDAGCGTGWFSQRASQRGAEVTALDIGPRLLEQVKRKCRARTVCGNVLDLLFDTNSFDVVISSECIEHTLKPQVAVGELIRVCRPGGLVAITSNNHFWHWLCVLANKLKLRPYEGIENWPRWSDFHSWFEHENVRILDRRGIHLFPFQVPLFHPVLKYLDRFGRFLGPVCVNQAILAMKQC